MSGFRELVAEELKYNCCESKLPKSSKKIMPLADSIGQERAIKAVEFGLGMKSSGYNIFISGVVGTGKITYAKKAVAKIAAGKPVAQDWVYVNNFDKQEQPIAIALSAGKGAEFRSAMEHLVNEVKNAIPKAFSSEGYEQARALILKALQEERSELFQKFNDQSETMGVTPQWSQTGFVGVPMLDGKALSQEEYSKLEKAEREEVDKRMFAVHELALEVIRHMQQSEREMREKLRKLDEEIALYSIQSELSELLLQYVAIPEIIDYLENVKKDMVKNVADFKPQTQEEDNMFAMFKKKGSESIAERYFVNLLVDNREQSGAPVVFEKNPTYYNLLGRVEYENRMNVVTTDYSMIKAGALHRANNGFLIVNARDLLTNIGSWDGLKRALRTRELAVENLGEQYSLYAMSSLRPQTIPLNVKIVLLGSPWIYHMLCQYDEEFGKLFKIHADFDVEMQNNNANLEKLTSFISSIVEEDKLRPFNRDAVVKIVEYTSRLAGSQKKLSTKFKDIVELICEADAWAAVDNKKNVDAAVVAKTIQEMNNRENMYQDRLHELFTEGKILVEVDGEKVGQINGLAVLDTGSYRFGKPSKITANTFMGRAGVVNIEREVNMSGQIHSKGVLTLNGYLGYKYAQHQPLSLSCSLTFEQEYGGIDGDSASSTELYAIISSLANVPIRQCIAVTGSVNQKGEVQPIGGATEKIEGYFAICKIKGLTGKQGVMIPETNVADLNLNDEVIQAVKSGKFHIYAVKTIDDGLELLTGKKAGVINRKGDYSRGSIHYLALQTLRRYEKHGRRDKDEDKKPQKAVVKLPG
ncbi:MAG: ATP-binding protein [Negativicutes bacterium]|jgi:lon-related putative ATP-dependent protease